MRLNAINKKYGDTGFVLLDIKKYQKFNLKTNAPFRIPSRAQLIRNIYSA